MKKIILLAAAAMMFCTSPAQTQKQSELKKAKTNISKKFSKIYKDAKKSVTATAKAMGATAKSIDRELGSIRIVQDTAFYNERLRKDSLMRDSVKKSKLQESTKK
jgi:hypothetical protein